MKWSAARRFNHPLSLLFFDIDDFRNFNNKYSHTTGNIILQTLVQRCRTILRSVDVFTRFGGMNLLPSCLKQTWPAPRPSPGGWSMKSPLPKSPRPHGDFERYCFDWVWPR